MAPLQVERPRGPRPRPRSQPPLTRPLSTGRTLQQASEAETSMLSGTSHSDSIKLLQSDLHDAISTQSRLMEDITELLSPPEKCRATDSTFRRESSTSKGPLAETVSNEASLQQEIKTLKAFLKQARYDHRTHLAKSLAEPSLKQEIAALNASLAQAASSKISLMHEVETLKTALTHALTSEREMRSSALQTREEWERVEMSLREEISSLRHDVERMRKELKGRKVVPFIQRLVLGTGGHEVFTLEGFQQDVQAEERGYVIYLPFSHDLISSRQSARWTLKRPCAIRRPCPPAV
jgi:hypothetical protein